jgi:ribose-phosphate pyrophosphokinase
MTGKVWTPSADLPAPVLPKRVRLFALAATAELGGAVARRLGAPLTAHEERGFEDGEHKARPLESVAGCDCYVINSLHSGPAESANDKLCRLLFFLGTLKDAGAARVTALAPYLCYARKDRRTKPFDPVTTRYVGALFEAVGTDVLVSLEVHNPTAFENAFRGRSVALSAAPLLIERTGAEAGARPVCVLSPDPGGAKRAELFREALEAHLGRPVGKAFADKHRSAGVVTGDLLVGDVQGAIVLIVDDLISTGGTLVRAARAAKAAGAVACVAVCAHGLFMPGATETLADRALDRIIITDAVPPFRVGDAALKDKLEIVPAAPLLAAAIARLAREEALTDLMVF